MLDQQIRGYVGGHAPTDQQLSSLTASGQLPKFAEESPSARMMTSGSVLPEVHNQFLRDEILAAADLPIYHCAYTFFDWKLVATVGYTRANSTANNSVELIKFVHPDTSEQEHQTLVQNAEAILQALHCLPSSGIVYLVISASAENL